MRYVKIVARSGETYSFAAVDQTTGEVPLKLADRAALLELCIRLGWTVDDATKRSTGLYATSPRQGTHHIRRHRVGGASVYTSSGRRRRARLVAKSTDRRRSEKSSKRRGGV